MPDEQLPNLGRPGEPCEECGAPLAADQRYCLECGHRRGAPRVDYRAEMAREAGAPGSQGEAATPRRAAAPVETGESAKGGRERDFAPLAAVGGIAVLGLMLLVGVLIGKGDSSASAPVTPQVVRVTGAGETGGGGGEGEGAGSGGGKKNTSSSEKKKQGGGSGGGEDKEVVEASTNELEELENESGEDAAKKALELPNKIATPGAPPPIDKSKPPGGGEGGGITIE